MLIKNKRTSWESVIILQNKIDWDLVQNGEKTKKYIKHNWKPDLFLKKIFEV